MGSEQIHAIRDLTVVIPAGKLVVIKGKSGSGKTTLLNLVAGIDEPTGGEIAVGGKVLSRMSQQGKVNLLRQQIGFIFQTFGLLPFLSVEENVEIPLRLIHTSRKNRTMKVKEMLSLVGLSSRAHHRTYELSGGEQQRVAIARALINQPKIILADEPTGQLDTATGTGIMELMREIVKQSHVTILVASHDPNVWQFADLVIELKDGQITVTTKIKLINRQGAKPADGAALPAAGPAVSDADKQAMKADIEGKLSDQRLFHRAGCERGDGCDCPKGRGCCKVQVRIVVDFVESGEHHVVNLFQGAGRANSGNWTRVKTRDNSYAHETGHLLGFYDEYAGGAVGSAPRWKVQAGVIMASGLTVPAEYYWDFRDWLKSKCSGEAWTVLLP